MSGDVQPRKRKDKKRKKGKTYQMDIFRFSILNMLNIYF
jgi:hypothetical protein